MKTLWIMAKDVLACFQPLLIVPLVVLLILLAPLMWVISAHQRAEGVGT